MLRCPPEYRDRVEQELKALQPKATFSRYSLGLIIHKDREGALEHYIWRVLEQKDGFLEVPEKDAEFLVAGLSQRIYPRIAFHLLTPKEAFQGKGWGKKYVQKKDQMIILVGDYKIYNYNEERINFGCNTPLTNPDDWRVGNKRTCCPF